MGKRLIALWLGIILLTVLLFSACGTSNRLAQSGEQAKTAYEAGDYATALTEYRKIISGYESKGDEKSCPVYTLAGEAAWLLDKKALAFEYYDKARFTASECAETYAGLATYFQSIDNLSKEMENLQIYLKKYPDGKDSQQIAKRLFSVYVESENWDKALNLWPAVKNTSLQDIALLEQYLTVNEALNRQKTCDSLVQKILNADPDNLKALEWEGKKYYRKAEDRYQQEMKAYEKKKTRKQYSQLLKALDQVSADFKTSLKYFEKLYKLNPETRYARYLANIYNRLNDKKKAAYYKKKAKL